MSLRACRLSSGGDHPRAQSSGLRGACPEGQLSRGAPARRFKHIMAAASANKMFLTRCKIEGLPLYARGVDAKLLLEGASVAATGSAAELKERAAVVVWARAHVGEALSEWEKLDDAAQARLVALYPGIEGAAGSSPLARARRAVRANMTPTQRRSRLPSRRQATT